MHELLKQAERSGDVSQSLAFMDVALAVLLGLLLSLALGWLYRYTHKGVSYSQTFVHTLVIFGCVVSLIMLMIGSNVARAFALVGALSIIRFRNAMKEPRDIGFIFMVMAIGMAVGTRLFLLAGFATATLSGFVVSLTKFNMFAKEVSERILRIRFPLGQDYETIFALPFQKYLEQYRVISLATVGAGALQEVVYSVTLKKDSRPQEVLEALRLCNDNQKVTLILGQEEVDI